MLSMAAKPRLKEFCAGVPWETPRTDARAEADGGTVFLLGVRFV